MMLQEIQLKTEIVFKSSKATEEVKGALAKLILRMINFFKGDLANNKGNLSMKLLNLAEN